MSKFRSSKSSEKKLIVTNNPGLPVGKEIEIERVKTLKEVLEKTRDLVQQGYRLLTHPLAGSLKPWQNPYRSIVLAEGENLDYRSLEVLENALERYRSFARNKGTGESETMSEDLKEDLKEDFSTIDRELIEELLIDD